MKLLVLSLRLQDRNYLGLGKGVSKVQQDLFSRQFQSSRRCLISSLGKHQLHTRLGLACQGSLHAQLSSYQSRT